MEYVLKPCELFYSPRHVKVPTEILVIPNGSLSVQTVQYREIDNIYVTFEKRMHWMPIVL